MFVTHDTLKYTHARSAWRACATNACSAARPRRCACARPPSNALPRHSCSLWVGPLQRQPCTIPFQCRGPCPARPRPPPGADCVLTYCPSEPAEQPRGHARLEGLGRPVKQVTHIPPAWSMRFSGRCKKNSLSSSVVLFGGGCTGTVRCHTWHSEDRPATRWAKTATSFGKGRTHALQGPDTGKACLVGPTLWRGCADHTVHRSHTRSRLTGLPGPKLPPASLAITEKSDTPTEWGPLGRYGMGWWVVC